MRGAFSQEIELPAARVFFRSSVLGCDRDLLIDAAVSSMPFALGCNLGNRLFQIFPELTDVISCVRPTETYGSDSDLTVPLEGNSPVNDHLQTDAVSQTDRPLVEENETQIADDVTAGQVPDKPVGSHNKLTPVNPISTDGQQTDTGSDRFYSDSAQTAENGTIIDNSNLRDVTNCQ